MNFATVALIVVGVVAVIAVITWLLYKAGFKVKEVTAKAGPLEAKMERDIGPDSKTETPTQRIEAIQEAFQGGRIKASTIKAPANSGASLKQKAEGEKSSITDSEIDLTN